MSNIVCAYVSGAISCLHPSTNDFPPLWSMLYDEDDLNPQEEDEWDSWYIEDTPPVRGDYGPAHNWKTDKAKAARRLPTI